MGLPLFRAPVEPEVCARNDTDKTTARARSTIRRQRTVRGPNLRTRAEPRREGPGSPSETSMILPPPERPSLPQVFAASIQDDEEQYSVLRRDFYSSFGTTEVPLLSLPTLERQSSLHIMEPPTFPDIQDNRRASMLRLYATRAGLRRLARDPQSSDPAASIRPAASAPSPPLESSAVPLSTDTLLSALSRHVSRANSPWSNEDPVSAHEELPPLRRFGRNTPSWIRAHRRRVLRGELANMDGLGDRNRSPSWEGDGAWDTLLTTLTPDPQPPSASSSFASASASTSATTNVESSGTPLTSFNDDVNIENVCDIVEEVVGSFSDLSGSDDDSDDEVDRDNDRSYANVASSTRPLPARTGGTEVSGTLGGLQRIIRRLAGREDIPDEWWAEVGLSRSFRPDEVV